MRTEAIIMMLLVQVPVVLLTIWLYRQILKK